jgi:hypothetical protein
MLQLQALLLVQQPAQQLPIRHQLLMLQSLKLKAQ